MGRREALITLGDQMQCMRAVEGMTLSEAARLLATTKGHLSNIENGRSRPSFDIVLFYEERFHADGQVWSAYVDSLTAPRPRQRANQEGRPQYPLPGDAATFVADVTIPDGTVMPPGFLFEKVWRIQNSGTVPWVRRWLARDGAPAGSGLPHSPYRVQIPDTSPGETVDIAVPLRAHPLEGTSQIRWKMVDDGGWEFFPDRYPYGLVLTIVVREGASPPGVEPPPPPTTLEVVRGSLFGLVL